MKTKDLIIIGGGFAGATAAIYASRYMIDVAILTKEIGGLASTAHKICNFPTYPEISGFELGKKLQEHVKSEGIEVLYEVVNEISKEKNIFKIKTSKNMYFAKNIIFATGTHHQTLGIKGEKEYLGKGVSYCATCDGPFFKDKIVAVVGGGNAALTSALLLSEHATKVYLIHRRKEFRGDPAWVNLVKKNKKIILLLEDNVSKINGSETVEGISLESGKQIKLDGIFIEIGSVPDIKMINLKLETDKSGYIITNENRETNIKGFYAAGDIVSKRLRQIVTASADGSIAALSVYNKLINEKGK